jgi:hypothetical protein
MHAVHARSLGARVLTEGPCSTPSHACVAAVQYWLAMSGDDGRVSVYDTERPAADTVDGLPAQLVLQHIGHLGNIMDCCWSPHDDYLLMSTSNDSETYKDGGALQLWRLSWLLHKPLEEAQEQLKSHQKWLVRRPTHLACMLHECTLPRVTKAAVQESGRIEDLPATVPPATAMHAAVGSSGPAGTAWAGPAAPPAEGSAPSDAQAGVAVATGAQPSVEAPQATPAAAEDVEMELVM